MTFSPLINGTIPDHGKHSSRNNNAVSRIIQHHHATVGAGGTNALTDPNAQKSVTYNITDDGTLKGQVDEEFRPWTSGGAAADDPSITIEIENSSRAVNGNDDDPNSWKISDAAYNTLVRLIADISTRRGFPINTNTYIGHRQVGQTACPGGYLWHRMAATRAAAIEFQKTGKLPNGAPVPPPVVSSSPIKTNMVELGDFGPLVLEQYVNLDNAWGAQCWDLWARYTDWLNLPRVNTQGGQYSGWVGAIWDQYGHNGAEKHWNRIAPNQPSVQGDVPIWGKVAGLYPATHIALTVEDDGDHLWVYSQNSSPSRPDNPYPNDSTGPTVLQRLPKTGLLGYLRHKAVRVDQVAPLPTPGKSIGQLADEVLAGKHGDGDARIASLGANYNAVQNEINRRFGAPQVVDISQLADQVLAGLFGDGDERAARLGADYAAVQAEINRRFAAPVVQNKSIAQLADEVLAGMHGDGDVRISSLGVNYNAVQNEINRRFGAPATVQSKTIGQLADEVLAGVHGDGDARVASLGGSYQAVQNEINRRFGG